MTVEIEQGEAFAARRQRFVFIESLMIHTYDPLAASVESTEPVPAPLGWSICRPDHFFTSAARLKGFGALPFE